MADFLESSLIKDLDDLFIVHDSNIPAAILVSPLLSGDNYNTWVLVMITAYVLKTN